MDVEERGIWLERARRVTRELELLWMALASDAPDEALVDVRDVVARVELTLHGSERSRIGARRSKVLGVLFALGDELSSTDDDDDAFAAWLADEAQWPTTLAGAFPDLEVALVAEGNRPLVIAAARAIVAAPRHGRKAAGSARGSLYGPVNELLAALPDGAGGNLRADTDANLRQLIRREKERVTVVVTRCSASERGCT